MVLGYSRRIFAWGYRDEGLTALLDGHARAFAHFGGRTATILYDNPRTIVQEKDEASGWVKWNATFKDRMDFYGVEIRLCRYYRARTKGKVESGVKYVKRNALAGRRWRDLEALNVGIGEWAATVADQRIHGTTHERPAERFARAEAAELIAVDARPPAPRERITTRVVPRDGLVAVRSQPLPDAAELGRPAGARPPAGRGDSPRTRRPGPHPPSPSCGQASSGPLEWTAAQCDSAGGAGGGWASAAGSGLPRPRG
jgi:hypothetical protein